MTNLGMKRVLSRKKKGRINRPAICFSSIDREHRRTRTVRTFIRESVHKHYDAQHQQHNRRIKAGHTTSPRLRPLSTASSAAAAVQSPGAARRDNARANIDESILRVPTIKP